MESKLLRKLTDVDVYGILGLESDCSAFQVRKAFRRKALECHPDKCPDDKKAAETFLLVSECCELLLDSLVRKEYDRLQEARRAKQLRDRSLGIKRKKLKSDLELRESYSDDVTNFRETVRNRDEAEERLHKLRSKGDSLLKQEDSARQHSLSKLTEGPLSNQGGKFLKLKWKIGPAPSDTYSESDLVRIFTKYGDVVSIVIRPPKKSTVCKCSALIEMKTCQEAEMAAQFERGLLRTALNVTVVNNIPVDENEFKTNLTNSQKHQDVSAEPETTVDQTENGSISDFELAILNRFKSIADSENVS